MFFDPMYFIIMGPAILLSMWASYRVHAAYKAGSQVMAACGATGAEAARVVLRQAGITNVDVEMTEGYLSDHYDPTHKVLRLSNDVYNGRSLAALGIAAHEAGHAIQDATRYPLMTLRGLLVPAASFGSSLSWILIMAGAFLSMSKLILVGVILFSAVVVFQLVNLPVEFDASSRAKKMLGEIGLVREDEAPVVRSVLSAAAMTYVAATLSAMLNLVYYAFILSGSSRSDD